MAINLKSVKTEEKFYIYKKQKIKKTAFFLAVLFIGMVLGGGLTYVYLNHYSKKTGLNTANQSSSKGNSDNITSQPAETKLFKSDALGYAMYYPSDWAYTASDNEITWNGPDGTDASDCQVDIQNALESTNLDSMVKTVKDEYAGENPQISNEKDYVYTMKDGTSLTGRSFEVNYVDGGQNQKDWQVIVPKEGKFFAWSYSSTADQYDKYFLVAQSMLKSWEIFK